MERGHVRGKLPAREREVQVIDVPVNEIEAADLFKDQL